MPDLILDSIFYYMGGLKILRGCYLEVSKNKITCLVGRNGSGKSTLLKISSGQLHADSGITIINGNRLHKKSKRERFRYLSYLPQKHFLPKSLKVSDLLLSETLAQDEILQRIAKNRLKFLSTGERRYLEILFTLSLKRDYMILDEPFTGLSPILIESVIERINQAKEKGAGILITDHYMNYVREIGDLFYFMENGITKPVGNS